MVRIRLFLTLLGFTCVLNMVKSECNLQDRERDIEFPDIMKYVAESYIMGVEYTIPGAEQTDYYIEYYDNIFKRGRIESHIKGENKIYIYRRESWEAWTLEGRKCKSDNITDFADFFKDDQTDWMHFSGSELPTTIGPSAMFKIAYDAWKNPSKDKKKMAYMGKSEKDIRGEPAVYWRRCTEGDNYVDYYFADEQDENPFDTDAYDRVVTPLRVSFNGIKGQEKALSQENYDIISFQHLIPAGVEPFELPKGRNCKRNILLDGPKMPDFSQSSMLLSAEVVYQRYSTKDDAYELMSSYYSTLMLALDRQIQHLAYYFSPWNTTKPDKDHDEPFIDAPYYIIYDMYHKYKYNISYETGKCEISRSKEFDPQYKMPENGGSLDLNNPYVLFPNNELYYLTSGKDRGLPVNIFEAEIEGFLMNTKEEPIKRAIATHSFLKSNVKSENNIEITGAPTQIQLRLYRKEDTEEVLTFNIFGFTTNLDFSQYIFDVTKCFKNDDDYSFLTIGFELLPSYVPEIPDQFTEIEKNILGKFSIGSELSVVRVPKIMMDVKGNMLYVTLMILEKPPLRLDFELPEQDKTIQVKNEEEDTQGMADFDACARTCLETKFDCWGFSLCGGTCYFGTTTNVNVESKPKCDLYRRANLTTILSKDNQINNIISQIEAGEFMIGFDSDSDGMVDLIATTYEVTDPAEDDSLFEKMGNMLNPRMRTLKAGKKLKTDNAVKNLGKLRFDECQRECLDFKECESLSYCLVNSHCILSNSYGSDLKPEDMVEDQFCSVVTRKYADHFDRTPGVTVKVGDGIDIEATDVEGCASACLRETKFMCLSFDHCSGLEKKKCKLYSTHYLNAKSRKEVEMKNPGCGHYTRKLSNDFKRKDETRVIGSKIPSITNLTLEECAKTCIAYGHGTCYGYDFCQDKTLFATTCTLFDSDPSRMKSTYSPVCTHYSRYGAEYAPRPYTNTYAGGIGFLCFLVGGVIGVIIVFAIAYIRVNRR